MDKIDLLMQDLENKVKISNTSRSPALVRAQLKYREKMKLTQPDLYRERTRQYTYKQFLKNKDKPEYKERNRETSKKYYENNKEEILLRRKELYQIKKLEKDNN